MISITAENGKMGSARLGLKLVIIFFVVLFLMIPLGMIGKIVDERKSRAIETEDEIVSISGGKPVIAGPVLIVPVWIAETGSNGKTAERRAHVAILAKELAVAGDIRTETRTRGIYRVPLISGTVRIDAEFAEVTELLSAALSGERYRADLAHARFELTFADRRSIKSTPTLSVNGGAPKAMSVGGPSFQGTGGTIRADAPMGTDDMRVSVTLEIGGGGRLSVYPFARNTRCDIVSDWGAPSFSGYALPVTREVTDKGFKASWFVPETAAPYPASFIVDAGFGDGAGSTLDVDFFQPISVYHKTERALKYGLLFVVLPFVVFFLFEVFARRRIHPLQYALIGIADVLFYLVLLSLSEHVPFPAAYAAGAIAVCALVSFYSSAALGSALRGLAMVPTLGSIYLYLYVALESEDYALLVGTIGVFAIVAFVMILTRRLDWYALQAARPQDGLWTRKKDKTAGGKDEIAEIVRDSGDTPLQ